MLGAAVSQLIVGPLSDRFGRRPVLLWGLSLYILASVAAMVAPTIGAFLVARLFQSMGAMAGPVIGRAIVRDRFDRARAAQVMAYVSLALAISPALAPVLGAFVHEAVGWRGNFGLIALFGMLIATLAFLHLGETNTHMQTGAGVGKLAGNYRRLAASPAFLAYALVTSLVFGAMFAFLAQAPFVFIELLGYSPKQYAGFSAITVCGFALGSWMATKLTLRLGIDRMILLGLAPVLAGAALLVSLAFALPLSAGALIGPITLILFGMGLVVPNGFAGAISVHPHIAGTGSALTGFLQMSTAGVATLIASKFAPLVAGGNAIPMTLVIAGFSVAAAASFGLRGLASAEALQES
jgi:DHA1 family bicyclomycin/chloramphenicol resistance-like MFS transporter